MAETRYILMLKKAGFVEISTKKKSTLQELISTRQYLAEEETWRKTYENIKEYESEIREFPETFPCFVMHAEYPLKSFTLFIDELGGMWVRFGTPMDLSNLGVGIRNFLHTLSRP